MTSLAMTRYPSPGRGSKPAHSLYWVPCCSSDKPKYTYVIPAPSQGARAEVELIAWLSSSCNTT